ncbi:MAG: NAD(P)H-hydrate dehydratase [Pseudomonadota bacterium]
MLTSAEMRRFERQAIERGWVTGLDLMERSGQGVVEAILNEWQEYRAAPQSVAVLCGPGNNGGDGFVIARLLHSLGWDVTVWFWGDVEKLPPDSRVNHDLWETLGAVRPLEEMAFRSAPSPALYVDALFGIGLSRAFEGALREFVQHLAGSGGDYMHYQPRMVSVDVPSGLCADTGAVLGTPEPSPGTSGGLFARLTVTFERPKPGHFLLHGPMMCGKLVVVPLGVYRETSGRKSTRGFYDHVFAHSKVRVAVAPEGVEPFTVFERPLSLQRFERSNAHKFSHGHVMVVAGGSGFGGAARLAARGALRMGAGLVTVACPQEALLENAARLDAIMVRAFDDLAAFEALITDPKVTTLVIGPGLGRSETAREQVLAVLKTGKPCVLDADGVSMWEEAQDVLFEALHDQVIMTPHAGEFARVFPDLSDAMQHPYGSTRPHLSKIEACQAAAKRAGCTVLLKGPDTVIARPDGRVQINASAYDRAAPQLATAGSGDVLAGFIAGRLAQGSTEAALEAAFAHTECALAFGPGLIAEDLPETLPQVLRQFAAP